MVTKEQGRKSLHSGGSPWMLYDPSSGISASRWVLCFLLDLQSPPCTTLTFAIKRTQIALLANIMLPFFLHPSAIMALPSFTTHLLTCGLMVDGITMAEVWPHGGRYHSVRSVTSWWTGSQYQKSGHMVDRMTMADECAQGGTDEIWKTCI